MACRAHGADLRVCATVAVEGRSRLVPLAPGTVPGVSDSPRVVKQTSDPG